MNPLVQLPLMDDDVAGVAGHVQHLQPGTPFQQPGAKLGSGHVGHNDIGDEQVERTTLAHLQRLVGIFSHQHFEPVLLQQFCHQG